MALENRSLIQRLQHLESTQLLDDAGSTDPLFLRSTLAPRHSDAVQRDIPFCVALLVMDNHDLLASRHGPSSFNELLRALAQRLAQQLPAAQQVVRAGFNNERGSAPMRVHRGLRVGARSPG